MWYSQKSTKIINILLLIAVISLFLGLLVFAYMGSFMRIAGDDYFYAAVLKQYGFWKGQVQAYMNPMLFHGDRYTLNFFSLFFSLFPAEINAVIPSFIILIFIAALYLFLSTLFLRLKLSISKLFRLFISLVIGFFTLWLAPTVTQGLYWRSSMLPSFAPIIGTLFLAAYILWQRPVKWPTILIAFFCALINAGFSENGAAYQTMMSVILFIAGFWAKLKKSQYADRLLILSTTIFFASILGVLIMWLSPGIANYHADMTTNLFSATILSLRYAFNHYKEMVISRFSHFVLLIFLGLITFLLSKSQNNQNALFRNKAPKNWILSLFVIQIITFLFIVSLTVPSAFIRNIYPDPRHFMGSTLVIVMSMLSSGFVLGALLDVIFHRTEKIYSKTIVFSAASLLVVISLAYPTWAAPQITAEQLKFKYWATQWDQRHQEILTAAAQGAEEIHVLRMDHIIEDVAELGPDPTAPWYNLPASQYYGIEIIADLPGWDEGFTEFRLENQ